MTKQVKTAPCQSTETVIDIEPALDDILPEDFPGSRRCSASLPGSPLRALKDCFGRRRRITDVFYINFLCGGGGRLICGCCQQVDDLHRRRTIGTEEEEEGCDDTANIIVLLAAHIVLLPFIILCMSIGVLCGGYGDGTTGTQGGGGGG